MAFITRIVLSKPSANTLEWDQWLATKDISILSSYPECVGMTLEQVVDTGVALIDQVMQQNGQISSDVTFNADGTSTRVNVFSAQPTTVVRTDINFNGHGELASAQVDSNGNSVYYTPLGYLQHLYVTETGVTTVTTTETTV